MKFTAATLSLGLATMASAAATPINAITAITQIAPTSTSCDGAQVPADCRTAEQIAAPVVSAMFVHGVYSLPQIAAILSLMAFESVEFKFKHNVSPGRPGQGTANMQMKGFNLEYAKSIPELSAQFAAFSSADAMSDADLAVLMEAVTDDKYNFGTGPWYFANKCDDATKSLVDTSPDAGFTEYMKCVGVEVTEDRLAYWTRAKAAFGLA